MTASSADNAHAGGPFGWMRDLRTMPPWRQAVYWIASLGALAFVVWDIAAKDAQYTNIATVALIVIATVALRAPNPQRGGARPQR